VCPALITRKLLIEINLQLINIFIIIHKFTNFDEFHVSTAVILLFFPHIHCDVMSQIPVRVFAKNQRNQKSRRLKDILLFPVKRMLFFALFQSQVSYGISVCRPPWGRTYHYLINDIQWVQNRAIKNLFGFSFLEETYDIHKRCTMFPIALLHFERSTSLLHNVYKSLTLSNFSLRENFQFHYHKLRYGG
jgi:hypothetical protein